jgi:hypothetical protein
LLFFVDVLNNLPALGQDSLFNIQSKVNTRNISESNREPMVYSAMNRTVMDKEKFFSGTKNNFYTTTTTTQMKSDKNAGENFAKIVIILF